MSVAAIAGLSVIILVVGVIILDQWTNNNDNDSDG